MSRSVWTKRSSIVLMSLVNKPMEFASCWLRLVATLGRQSTPRGMVPVAGNVPPEPVVGVPSPALCGHRLMQCGFDLMRQIGLGEKPHAARKIRNGHSSGRHEGRHGRPTILDQPDQSEAIHRAGHLNVGED